MLPMGTIMAASMLVGASYCALQPFIKSLNTKGNIISLIIGSLVMLGGLWNVLWYASQHLHQFWGQAAFVSGVLMIITALFIYQVSKLPKSLVAIRPLILLALFGCSFLYGYTIYNL